ncbi:MAG TPA: hypothetical protein VGJ59_13410 [Jatrophihabitantaceae bacterium]|jgi:hypothetical protein
MIWLAWRQFRAQAAVVFGALAVLAIVLIVTGLRLRHWYDTDGLANCTTGDACDALTSWFTGRYSWLQTLLSNVLILFLPGLTGVFWGAPLIARELESGTYRLAWTQSVTRTRWLAGKIAVVGTASVAASALLTWMVSWWYTPFDKIAHNKFDPTIFSERDLAPIGYAAFGFALGLIAGLLIRRTLPAMATTLVGYIAARIIVVYWIRPHFQAPLHITALLQQPGAGSARAAKAPAVGQIPQGSWIVSTKLTDPSGHSVGAIRIPLGSPCMATNSCVAGYHQTLTYQPASRYWPFQWYELTLFTGVALILIGFCFWWINGHSLRPASGGAAHASRPDATLPSQQAPAPVQ